MKVKTNKTTFFSASLESTMKDIEKRVKKASLTITKDDRIIAEIAPTRNGPDFEAEYSFPKTSELGTYAANWIFDFGGTQTEKTERIELVPDVEINSEIKSGTKTQLPKTPCQLMAELAIHEKIEHYHGIIDLKDKESYQYLDRYKGKKGFFIKKLIINDKLNLNDWGVTWEAIKLDGEKFLGKPIVLTPDKDHPPVSEQEDYRIGQYIDVQPDEVNRSLWGVGEIFDKKAQEMIRNREIQFGSPTVLVYSQETREQQSKGTPFQKDILHRFNPAHDALVGDPAYGKNVDKIKAICEGDGEACALKLLTVSASRQYREMEGQYEAKDYPWDQCIRDQTKKYGPEGAKKVCGYIKEKYGSYNEKIASIVDSEHEAAEINGTNTDQITTVPFIRKIINNRFSKKEQAEIVGHIMSEKEAADESCVSKQIRHQLNSHPSMDHDQAIAIAYSECGEPKKGAIEERGLETALVSDMINLSKDVTREQVVKKIEELEKKFNIAKPVH
jgi:hypothetical protein